MLTQCEVDRRMREAGLAPDLYASLEEYGFLEFDAGDIRIDYDRGEGNGPTFEQMAQLAEVFNTRQIDVVWQEGGALSEVTFESGYCRLRIRGAS